MNQANLVFPHQLFENSPLLNEKGDFILVEETLYFSQFNFHKGKLAHHRGSMKFYESYLKKQGKFVTYIEGKERNADVRELLEHLSGIGIDTINYIDPTDNWLHKRIKSSAKDNEIALNRLENPLFLNTTSENQPFFRSDKKKFYQTSFYKDERKKRGILVDSRGEPEGGKWTFDTDNRKRYPRKKKAPNIFFPERNEFHNEAYSYVKKNFSENIGELNEEVFYPIDFKSSKLWLQQFFEERFQEFGDYEDAIVKDELILNHSVLTPMMNVGLLTPSYVLQEALDFAKENDVPINSLEGFVRQIMGWREFIRGVYEAVGSKERTTNFWGFERKIPQSFYNGTTGIEPVDSVIKKVLRSGYCHHIERLMVLGNFMLLCEFDPDEVYRWFMELFIDAYDWVMVTNVYGMSQFADGGLMATKPYISSSNYLMKMSNYKKGDWQDTWDALFWRFMNINRDFFLKNPRMGMLIRTYDKMDSDKQEKMNRLASNYLANLDQA